MLPRRRRQPAQGEGGGRGDRRPASRALPPQAAPGPDFLTFSSSTTGAGPYKFASFTPGVELVLDAFDQYWRKTPSVKRLVFRVISDESTRLAASLAIDRPTINQALILGHSKLTGNIIPSSFEFFWQPPAPTYNAARTKQLLAEAVVNNLQAVGIRVRLRPLERAAFFSAYSEKKLKNIIQGASGAFGNAATRLEAFVVTSGTYVYGSDPDLDGLFQEQAAELDRKRREATPHRMQQLVYDKVMYAPIRDWPS